MSLRNLVEDYLEREPQFRERKTKDRGLVNLLIERYGLHHLIESGELTKDRIIAMVQDYASMDRAWRKTLEERPEFRGSDYDEKDSLEVEKMRELGYPNARNVGEREIETEKQPSLL